MPRTASRLATILFDRQRERLLAAAQRVFARRGLAATMDDIAGEAGVSHGLAYRYFASKEAIFGTLVEQAIAAHPPFEGVLQEPGTPGERLEAVIRALVDSRRHPESHLLLSHILASEAAPAELLALVRRRGQTVHSVLRQLIVEGQAAGEVAAGDPDQLVRAVVAFLEGLLCWAVYDPEHYERHFPDSAIVLRMLRPR